MTAATAEGTKRYVERMIARGALKSSYRVLGKTGLHVSLVGFGTYRVSTREPEQREALRKALLEGCNLIDTSTNYMDGGAESLIGEVLAELFESGDLQRDEVVVVSKIGYVQGSNLVLAERRETQKRPYADMVKYMEGCWHCIHPEFIEEQLERSLARLGLNRLDACLLHNPEYYLSDEANRHPDKRLDHVRDVFYDRVRRAFKKFEDAADKGILSYYGVSSNNFGQGPHEREATSVEQMWEIAGQIGKDRGAAGGTHRFAVIQLPLNLLESGPVLVKNSEGDRSTLEFCRDVDLAVLANRPLNAIDGNRMIRLADMQIVKPVAGLKAQLASVKAAEEEFIKDIAPLLETEDESLDPKRLFYWGHELSATNLKSVGLEQWKQVEFQVIRPQVTQLAQVLDRQLVGDLAGRWKEWRATYLPRLVSLLETIRGELSRRSKGRLDGIFKAIDDSVPGLRKESSSRKALAVVAHTPGVTSVLNGMRTVKYVDDALGLLRLAPVAITKKTYEMVSAE